MDGMTTSLEQVVTVAERPITLEAFLALPEEKPALEYFGGRITQKIAPGLRHSLVRSQILCEGGNRLLHTRFGIAVPELRITMGGASRVPDVAIFRWDRIPRDEHGELLDDVVTPPDVVVEVLSPGQTHRAMLARCHWYIEQGVQAALLVQPRARWIDVVRADSPIVRLTPGDTLDLSAVIADLLLAVSEIFALVTI
jgi:Uma2 family endonuclease